MKILGWEFKKESNISGVDDKTNFRFWGELIKEDLSSYDTILKIEKEVIKNITEQIYPDIKNMLLENKNFEKIINEMRLQITKKL